MNAQKEAPLYLGVDVAGAKNTWVAGLQRLDGRLEVSLIPRLATLEDIIHLVREHHIVAVAIDAQLSTSPSDETGFRSSDIALRSLLPPDCKNWVASINSLMAVPVRGQLLAAALAPVVGTIIETHPRASLYFGLGNALGEAVRKYKKGQDWTHGDALWRAWISRFELVAPEPPHHDGALDALVCATTAYLYHHAPDRLLHLRHNAPHKTGQGPFYILAPP